ncbi:MAG: DNA polymerase III subunit epsilon [Corynebacterium sp.]|nr:DNA polymerase III subunit epsilon [Corynebacterium sp.]
MAVKAQGAVLTIARGVLTVAPTQLSASLAASARRDIELADITDLIATASTDTLSGALHIITTHDNIAIVFPPNADVAECKRWIENSAKQDISAEPLALFSLETQLEGSDNLASTGATGLDFVAMAVHNEEQQWGSITAVAAARFRDGMPANGNEDRKFWTCKLGEFATIAADIASFIGNDVLVAHNVQFVATALNEAMRAAHQPQLQCATGCTLALARHATAKGMIAVENHQLAAVAQALGIDYSNDSADYNEEASIEQLLIDAAQATGLVLSALTTRFDSTTAAGEGVEAVFASQGLCLGSIGESGVMPVLRLNTAPLSSSDLGAGTDFQDDEPARATNRTAPSAGSATERKQPERKQPRRPAPWESVATPDTIPSPNPDADQSSPLYGENVTLTGDFDPFDKGVLWNGIAHHGGTVGKNVTKKTTILVIGSWANKTSKEKRAEELNEKGQGIQMWTAERLFEVLNLEVEPPF